jgi:5-methylcytosine-specific restriction endonuclease McrA
MPRPGTRTERGYGRAYQMARATLLATHPPCWWCGAPATTADHVPPLAEVGHPHYNLVPACKPCNSGRVNKRQAGPSRDW